MLRKAALCLILSALPALAQSPETGAPETTNSEDPALSAAAFEALTAGRTMDTYDAVSGLYGIETFLPGRRVVWKDADGCMNGTWHPVDQQICFVYDGGQNNPVCWTYHDRGDWIEGFFQGDRNAVPIELRQGGAPVSCGEFLGV